MTNPALGITLRIPIEDLLDKISYSFWSLTWYQKFILVDVTSKEVGYSKMVVFNWETCVIVVCLAVLVEVVFW